MRMVQITAAEVAGQTVIKARISAPADVDLGSPEAYELELEFPGYLLQSSAKADKQSLAESVHALYSWVASELTCTHDGVIFCKFKREGAPERV